MINLTFCFVVRSGLSDSPLQNLRAVGQPACIVNHVSLNDLKMKKIVVAIVGVGLTLSAFSQKHEVTPANNERLTHVPQWAREAIWYQIFVERFRNGDASNDPTRDDIRDYVNNDIPGSWKVTPWTQDWYKPDAWFSNLDPSLNFSGKVQFRRYGGDLQGVLDKMGYLQELGITAIYFNPLNDAPSMHKYDASYWHHIDRNFGPSPKEDAEAMLMENHDNPKEWAWTNADKLFLRVIEEAHKRGMKVVMDFSWNHTGTNFWAFQDVLKKGEKSKYKDWYVINRFDNPSTPQNEFDYQGWVGVKTLPEIRETVHHPDSVVEAYEGNIYSESLRRHIFEVVKRWADPNGDGNPADGIDGIRLDVAAELPLGFWREFRQVCRSINPEMYLIGEVWWEKWPDKLLDPLPFVKGDVFDANMNYRWYRTARHFFDDAPNMLPVTEFVKQMNFIFNGVRPEVADAYMNMTSSHDSPRLSTSLYNRGKYKYHVKPFDDPKYKINRPDAITRRVMELLLVHQYTFIGSPQIWNGDEMGMWGADDPDCRKPLIWPDYKFDDEVVHPLGLQKPVDRVTFDSTTYRLFKQLIVMRKTNPALVIGSLKYLITDNANRILVYRRSFGKSEALVAFNMSDNVKTISIPATQKVAYVNPLNKLMKQTPKKGKIMVTLQPKSSVVLIAGH